MADTVSVRLPRAIVDKIRLLADAHRRTITGELQVALEAYLATPEAQRILGEREG